MLAGQITQEGDFDGKDCIYHHHRTAAGEPGGHGTEFRIVVHRVRRLSLDDVPAIQSGPEAEACKLMVEIFSLVLPQKVSEKMVNDHVKLTYDPVTKELVQMQMVMPFLTSS